MPEQRKALIYCRVSRKAQEEEGTSLESQEQRCIEFAVAHGYNVCRITKEVYSGAELWDRPMLARDRADIRAKQFQALICYATDRLSRNPIHLAIIAEECERVGAELIFVTEPLDNSPEGALIRYVKGYAAQIERAKIRERSMRGKYEKYLSGRYVQGGPNLYGYFHNKETGLREVIESEARIVRQIYEWAAEGIGCRGIAKRLNRSGVPSPSKGKINYSSGKVAHRWNSTNIRRYIREPAYKGETYACRWKSARPVAKAVPRDKSEWIRLPDNVTPAIVSKELWERANAMLKTNAGEWSRNAKYPALLRGLLYCSVCNRKLYLDKKQSDYTYFRCSSRTYTTPCGARLTRANECEEWAWNLVRSILEKPDMIERGLRSIEDAETNSRLNAELKATTRELDKLQRAEQRLLRQLREADDEVASLIQAELKQVLLEKRQVGSVIEGLKNRLNKEAVRKLQLKSVYDLSSQIRDRLETFTFDEKVRTLNALRVKIYTNGDKYRLDVPVAGGEMQQGHLY